MMYEDKHQGLNLLREDHTVRPSAFRERVLQTAYPGRPTGGRMVGNRCILAFLSNPHRVQ
jgi:hypothetical protein